MLKPNKFFVFLRSSFERCALHRELFEAPRIRNLRHEVSSIEMLTFICCIPSALISSVCTMFLLADDNLSGMLNDCTEGMNFNVSPAEAPMRTTEPTARPL